jgi:hypothetical protein
VQQQRNAASALLASMYSCTVSVGGVRGKAYHTDQRYPDTG